MVKIKEVIPNQPGPHKGGLLLSEPFLDDPHFRRTVVLLGEHNEDGSVGFILNRLLNITTQTIVPDLLDMDFPVFYGGPVEPNTLHYIHTGGEEVPGAQKIAGNLYWGGDIEIINKLLLTDAMDVHHIRFFVGYSGWDQGQLQNEIEQRAWWTATLKNSELIFNDELENMWGDIVKTLGPDFAYLANSPEDPQWN